MPKTIAPHKPPAPKAATRKLPHPGLTSTTTPAGIAALNPDGLLRAGPTLDEIKACVANGSYRPAPPQRKPKPKQGKAKGQPRPAVVPPTEAEATPDIDVTLRVRSTIYLRLDQIEPSPDNPRQDWQEARLQELGRSLVEHGQLVPLQVLPPDDAGLHTLIDGESRWRASKLVGYQGLLRCEIVDCTAQQAAELRLISSLKRKTLNPIEEARGLQLLVSKHGCSQRDLAERIGLSQGQISNRLRLLELPDAWQGLVISGEITATFCNCSRSISSTTWSLSGECPASREPGTNGAS